MTAARGAGIAACVTTDRFGAWHAQRTDRLLVTGIVVDILGGVAYACLAAWLVGASRASRPGAVV